MSQFEKNLRADIIQQFVSFSLPGAPKQVAKERLYKELQAPPYNYNRYDVMAELDVMKGEKLVAQDDTHFIYYEKP